MSVKKMKILICDDEIKYIDILKAHLEEYIKKRLVKNAVIETATDPNDIFYGNSVYDIVFLDIQMNEVNGFDLARELIDRNSKVILFFVTAFDGYQDDAMDIKAFRYFEKPFDVCRLYSGMDKALEYLDETYIDLFLHCAKEQNKVLVDDIIYIESRNRHVVVVTKQGEYITRKPLYYWLSVLPNTFFYQVHNSFIVNLHYVKVYKYCELILDNGTRIAISPRKQAEFHRFWPTYLNRRTR